uniref:Uncharacterized protein n=1 Tax=Ficedula albicollis TaxID=59894 RepID=A0A803W5C0_FICAL
CKAGKGKAGAATSSPRSCPLGTAAASGPVLTPAPSPLPAPVPAGLQPIPIPFLLPFLFLMPIPFPLPFQSLMPIPAPFPFPREGGGCCPWLRPHTRIPGRANGFTGIKNFPGTFPRESFTAVKVVCFYKCFQLSVMLTVNVKFLASPCFRPQLSYPISHSPALG